MFAQLPMYQRQGASAYKVDLTNSIGLSNYIGNPEKKFKSIHVAGTNGKGSTCHMLASVLQEAGYKVGLYTSPHLKDFRERIKVNGEVIGEDGVIDFISTYKTFIEKNQLSFFEMTVGMAFQYFAISKVDIAVIEVGLGGRLDSTNIITPEVSVITNIGIDHTQFLGTTLEKIANEKAGIIKKNIPVVVGKTTVETKAVFDNKAREESTNIIYAENYIEECFFKTDLKGKYQEENKNTVLQVIKVLNTRGWNIDSYHISNGLRKVVANTGLLGRWQILFEKPKVICDTAHNEDGLRIVTEQLKGEKYKNLHIVLGVVKDKDLDSILPLFPKFATYYFAKPSIQRGMDANNLQKKAKKYNLNGSSYATVEKAYNAAKEGASENDLIYVGGSTFVVSEII